MTAAVGTMPIRVPRRELTALLLSAGVLLTLGIVMIGSASMDIAAESHGNPLYFVLRQSLYAVLGCLAGLAAANIPLVWWLRGAWLWLAGAFALLILVLTPLGITVNGSTRWISMGAVNLQVSEAAKWLLVVYLAGYVVRRHAEVVDTWPGVLKPLAVLGAASVLLLAQPDFGAVVVLMAAAFGVIFVSGVGVGRFLVVSLTGLALGVAALFSQPYRIERLVAYLDPWQDQFNSGYQLTQALIAFGRGEWTGVGLGNSIQKLFYLPEAHTDFIFAIAAEEFGLLGALCILMTFTVLVLSGLRIARQARDAGMTFGACLAYGLTLLIALQAYINMGVNTGLLPTKGLTLPLVSYGGSSLVISCVTIGVIARVQMEVEDQRAQEGGEP
ncbi:putative lipid II flippase FtsW [Salicola sp. Rm-C-2C1-2]|uniref:putative lipid II flippase FtsW n=1 Tax=Salicola sp. Rm-C-2C1-2 TaxID=3141321 RepID=UPI0032E42813